MDRAFQDASVSGWGGLLPALRLPDPDDAHVLAAAIAGRADVIITLNLKDFPQSALEPYEIEVIGPGEFLLDQLDLAPDLVLEAVRRQAEDSRRPPVDLSALLEHLARCGVPQFAAAARARQWRIADRWAVASGPEGTWLAMAARAAADALAGRRRPPLVTKEDILGKPCRRRRRSLPRMSQSGR